jgi:hypothetical protein
VGLLWRPAIVIRTINIAAQAATMVAEFIAGAQLCYHRSASATRHGRIPLLREEFRCEQSCLV